MKKQKCRTNLITSNNMNNHKHVGCYDEPCRLLQGDQDVVLDFIAKSIISDEGHREIAQSDDCIGNDYPSPHKLLGWLVR